MDIQQEDNLGEGIQAEVEDSHRVAEVDTAEVDIADLDIRHLADKVDQASTFAAFAELPSVVDQTCRLFCPFLPCVESACTRKPCSRPDRQRKKESEMLL